MLTPTVLGDAPWYSEFSQSDNRTRTQEQDVFTQPVNIAGNYYTWSLSENVATGVPPPCTQFLAHLSKIGPCGPELIWYLATKYKMGRQQVAPAVYHHLNHDK